MHDTPTTSHLFLHHEGQQLGPYPIETVRDMVAAGTMPPDVPAWYDGLPDWVPLSTLVPSPAMAQAPAPASAVRAAPARSDSFFKRLPGACLYPLKKDGLILLVTGTIFFWLLDVAAMFAGLVSLLLGLFSGGYLAACMQNIIQSSAQGDDQMPSWPEFSDMYQDILMPFFRLGLTSLVCLGPGIMVLGLGGPGEEAAPAGRLWMGGLLLAGGAVYLPMGLLAVAMADSLAALSPTVVIPSILRVPGPYAVACAVLGVAFVLDGMLAQAVALLPRIPVVSTMLQGFVGLFWLTVEMRVLGLLYYCNRQRLQWF